MSAQVIDFEPRKLMDKKALAEFLDVSVFWIDKRLKKGSCNQIPHLKFGRLVRFDPHDSLFKKWLEDHRVSNGNGS